MIKSSGDIDVYVITGEAGESRPLVRRVLQRTSNWSAYLVSLLIVGLATGVAALTHPYFELSNLVMLYLLAVILVATRFGRGPSVLATILSVAFFDFFFVPPYLSFDVSDTEYIITFVVMLIVALVISNLTVRTKGQAEAAREREQRTAALYAMSRDLTMHRRVKNLTQVGSQHIRTMFQSQVAVFLPDANGRLILQPGEQMSFVCDAKNKGVAQWVFDHAQIAGVGTDTLLEQRPCTFR